MASLKVYVEQVKRLIAGGHASTDLPWGDREIALALGQKRDETMWEDIIKNSTQSDSASATTALIEGLLVTYTGFTAVCDTLRKLYYVPLIKDGKRLDWVKGLPGDSGLFRLFPSEETGKPYRKLTPSFMSLYQNTPAFWLEGDGGYWPETHSGDQRLYLHPNFKDGSPSDFSLMIVPAIDNDTDMKTEMNIPGNVVAAVAQMYLSAGQPDLSNNNNPVRA